MPTRQGAPSRAMPNPLESYGRRFVDGSQNALRAVETVRQALPPMALKVLDDIRTARRGAVPPFKAKPGTRAVGVLAPKSRPAPGAPRSTARSQDRSPWSKSGEVAYAGAKGLQHALTLGQDDKVIAAVQTVLGAGPPGKLTDRFASNLEVQKSMAERAAREHPIASAIGENAGLAAGFLVASPEVLRVKGVQPALQAAARYRRATTSVPRLVTKPREYAVVAGVGGVSNAGLQAGLDAVPGGEPSWRRNVGAGVGGAAGSLATIAVGPRLGGAVEGGLTPAAQAMLERRLPSVDEVRNGLLTGYVLGSGGGAEGARWANALKPKAKGTVGEVLSAAKTLARLEAPSGFHKQLNLKGGGYTIQDHATSAGDTVEAKLGEWADLSKRQRQAQRERGEKYRVDRWRAADVGKIFGFTAGTLGAQFSAGREDRR